MTTINSVHTSCKNCVFAKYDGITQIDCELKFIDIYKNHDIEIIEAYDNDKEFYIINTKKCIGYREQKWFDSLGMQNSNLQDKINKFNETNILNYLAIIDLELFNNIEDFRLICENISQLPIKPQKIIFVRHIDEKLEFTYDKLYSVINSMNLGCEWTIQTILDESINHDQTIFDITISNPKYRFILSVISPDTDLKHIIIKANQIVHKDLGQFLILSNLNKTALIYSSIQYRYSVLHNEEDILLIDKYYTFI